MGLDLSIPAPPPEPAPLADLRIVLISAAAAICHKMKRLTALEWSSRVMLGKTWVFGGQQILGFFISVRSLRLARTFDIDSFDLLCPKALENLVREGCTGPALYPTKIAVVTKDLIPRDIMSSEPVGHACAMLC